MDGEPHPVQRDIKLWTEEMAEVSSGSQILAALHWKTLPATERHDVEHDMPLLRQGSALCVLLLSEDDAI